ncbi:tRNA (adenosine(37)-N6)-threonylcarbamoyltransferase complex ATPase subunit type 1 TsaE [Paracoccaceae bacterium]|nr:tRNA (adenosine(37)-N6)-threonylcarbamoyltransferase complex ATPase subunit type 1 TsaE [Paracoccaceae bacterium]
MLADPNIILKSYDLDILDLSEIGMIFAEKTKNSDLLLLSGRVGAGKTEFARQIIKSKALKENLDIEEISSPTFSLIQSYDFQYCKISHIDLYRVNSEEELFELGIPDIFDNQITLIEWPEILETKNFSRNVSIEIKETKETKETRVIKIEFFGSGWGDLIVSLLESRHFSD